MEYSYLFSFACRTLFKDASGTLDKSARFSPLYRQDGNKLSNDDMLKLLVDFRKSVTSPFSVTKPVVESMRARVMRRAARF